MRFNGSQGPNPGMDIHGTFAKGKMEGTCYINTETVDEEGNVKVYRFEGLFKNGLKEG